MKGAVRECQLDGRVAYRELSQSYLVLLRTSERIAENLLRGEDVAFYAGKRHVEEGDSPGVDTVEVRFKGSEGKQERKAAMLVGMKGDGN